MPTQSKWKFIAVICYLKKPSTNIYSSKFIKYIIIEITNMIE